MDTENEALLPQSAKDALQANLAQLKQLQQSIHLVFQGVILGMGLEGQWTLDIERMIAVRQQAEEPIAEDR